VTIGPLPSRAGAVELKEQLDSLFGLRHCGRKLRLRPWPSAYGQMGRCLSPCLNDLDPNLYRRRLDAALALFTGGGDALSGPPDGGAALLAHIDEQMRAAAADERFERAAWLRRRRERIAVLVRSLAADAPGGGAGLAATHARPRLVLAGHARAASHDVFWLVGGRLADWDGLEQAGDLHARTLAALAGRHDAVTQLPAEAVAEVRIVQTWLASHDAAALALRPIPTRAALDAFLASGGARAPQPNGSSTTSAVASPPATSIVSPMAASRRTSASAIGPCVGETIALEM
jgi:DNA polymerase-3 subunit epsilon